MTRRTLGPARLASTGCALMLAMVLLPTAARAQAPRVLGPAATSPRLELGFFGGLHLMSDTELGVHDETMDTFGNALALGARLGFALTGRLSVEAEAAVLAGTTRISDNNVTAIAWRLQALAHAQPQDHKLRPFALLGAGGVSVPSDNQVLQSDTDLALHLGAGAIYRFDKRVGLRVDARALFPPSSTSEGATVSWELWVGVTVPLGAAPGRSAVANDTDRDGVPDSLDACPRVAENLDGVDDDDGCPEPTDPDADGVAGGADRCPNQAEDMDGFEDDDGCPDVDNDNDGIDDSADRCPLVAETLNGIDDDDGCPETDNDEDGLWGSADRCPELAEDLDGFQDQDGCPDIDNDADGVVDSSDGCPVQAGPPGNRGCPDTDADGDGVVDRLDNCPSLAGTPQNFGCTSKQRVKLTDNGVQLLQKVRFRTAKARNPARIHPRSRRLLNNLATVLIAQPSIARVRVAGHTDDPGDDAAAKELSRGRAHAVVSWLISAGVPAGRLEAVGYGGTQPTSTNATKKGRDQNRRIEITFVGTQWLPAPAPPAAGPKPPPPAPGAR